MALVPSSIYLSLHPDLGNKGLWVGIGIRDEAVDRILEFLEGTEDAALEAPLRQEREHTLDRVEPARWGCRPCARQMRCTELTLIPAALAMAAPVQWVAFDGGPAKV